MMTTQTKTYYHDVNGRIACVDHAGNYLRAEYDANPDGDYYETPLGAWFRLTADVVAGLADSGIVRSEWCETCRGR